MSDRCSIDGCERPRRSRDWCNRHYEHWRRYGVPEAVPRTAMERFWSKFVRGPGGCWLWTGWTISGYGMFSVNGDDVLAHRFAYEWLVGPVPDGLELDHLCRVRACCNPAHLEPVTHWENMLRGASGDLMRARRSATECVNGHPFDEANTYLLANGARRCRACRAAGMRRRYREKRP